MTFLTCFVISIASSVLHIWLCLIFCPDTWKNNARISYHTLMKQTGQFISPVYFYFGIVPATMLIGWLINSLMLWVWAPLGITLMIVGEIVGIKRLYDISRVGGY